MFHGALALLGRSLRIDARSWSTHFARLGLVIGIYCALCLTVATEDRFGAPGLRFFTGIAYLDVAFITLVGLGYFSNSITEEKEEDTLGLMLMAGISPLGILAGKSGSRLWQALLLVAVQYPLMTLAVTMGGVSGRQIAAVTVALLAFIGLLAGYGLLCSTLASNSRRASGWMFAGLIAYYVVPMIARSLVSYQKLCIPNDCNPFPEWIWNCLEGMGDSSILSRLDEVLTTGFAGPPWSLQFFCNLMGGVTCAGFSWLLFGFATRSPATESMTRDFVARDRSFFRFPAGRPKGNPFIWKDFHFVSGGFGTILIRVAFYGTIAGAAWLIDFAMDFPFYNEYMTMTLLWMSLYIAIDAAMILSRSMHDEVRGQTLASLMMLPHSSTAMIYSKFAGAMLGWIPGPLIELLFTLSTRTGRRDFWGLTYELPAAGVMVFLLFALIPHFAAILALYVRWGAVPISVGLTIVAYLSIVMLNLLLLNSSGPPDGIFFLFGFVYLCLCVGCHLGLVLRVQALGAR